jgi:hypothetical protein
MQSSDLEKHLKHPGGLASTRGVVFLSSFEVKEILKRADLEDGAGDCRGF